MARVRDRIYICVLSLLVLVVATVSQRDLDVGFIISGSSNICEGSPVSGSACKNWDDLRKFVASLIDSLPRSGTRVGAIFFGYRPSVIFPFNRYSDLQKASEVFNSIQYPNSPVDSMNTAQGIQYAQNRLFNSRYGDRPDISNVAIIMHDGMSGTDIHKTIPTAWDLQRHGVRVISVGIGNSINETEIKFISSLPYTKGVDYFTSLDLQGVINSLNNRYRLTLTPPTRETTTTGPMLTVTTTSTASAMSATSSTSAISATSATSATSTLSEPNAKRVSEFMPDIKLVIIIVPIIGGIALIAIIIIVICIVRRKRRPNEVDTERQSSINDPVYNDGADLTRPNDYQDHPFEDPPIYSFGRQCADELPAIPHMTGKAPDEESDFDPDYDAIPPTSTRADESIKGPWHKEDQGSLAHPNFEHQPSLAQSVMDSEFDEQDKNSLRQMYSVVMKKRGRVC